MLASCARSFLTVTALATTVTLAAAQESAPSERPAVAGSVASTGSFSDDTTAAHPATEPAQAPVGNPVPLAPGAPGTGFSQLGSLARANDTLPRGDFNMVRWRSATDPGRWIDFGILVELEFLNNAPSEGEATQELFFRRLRPTLMGGLSKDWQGILQMDFGAGQNGTTYTTTVRWANFQYLGVHQAHATFGSFKPWYSRELITLGPHLQTIERSPVGDTNYGNPDYMLGVAWDQMLDNGKWAYYASAGMQSHQQEVTQMQMRSPANTSSSANEGLLVSGRVDFYPFGRMTFNPKPLNTPTQITYNRGDFHTPDWRLIVSAAAFGWWNDGDSNPYTENGVSTSTTQADLDRSVGVEVSGGLRGHSVSADAEYQHIWADLVDPAFTGGLYAGGATDLSKFVVNGGYMLPIDVELAASWSTVAATGFEKALTETTVGANWYIIPYAVRFSATYSWLENQNGTPGNDVGVTRLFAQFVW
jgi:hypothetical protein